MVEVGQAVDDGDRGSLLQLPQCGVTVHSSEHNVTESRENTEAESLRSDDQITFSQALNLNVQTVKNQIKLDFEL